MAEARRVVNEQGELPPGYATAWSGQDEYMVRAKERLATVVIACNEDPAVIEEILTHLDEKGASEIAARPSPSRAPPRVS